MANQQLDQQTAKALIAAAEADACAWGKDYIAHPDLVRCFDEGLPLNEADSSTFYGGGARGYTDYPFAE